MEKEFNGLVDTSTHADSIFRLTSAPYRNLDNGCIYKVSAVPLLKDESKWEVMTLGFNQAGQFVLGERLADAVPLNEAERLVKSKILAMGKTGKFLRCG